MSISSLSLLSFLLFLHILIKILPYILPYYLFIKETIPSHWLYHSFCMTNSYYSFSLKKERSSSNKQSRFNVFLNKITSTFSQKKNHPMNELMDYFRTDEKHTKIRVNDSFYEYSRYQQQKSRSLNEALLLSTMTTNDSQIIPSHSKYHASSINTTNGILINPSLHTTSNMSFMTDSKKSKKSKHKRHYSHISCISSSNITVNSEDLTAKEFADIAGIKILSEYELNNECSEPNSVDNRRKSIRRCVFCDNDDIDDSKQPFIVTFHSSIDSIDNQLDEPDIWDNSFWEHPTDPTHAHYTMVHELGDPINSDPVKSSNPISRTIKRGRFEITVVN
ncbi:hypothetical protein BDB01DRAFT_776164 [Pilobolus umbonatus]|nr:hypothetical protein BDB01DRAFT_776164 [Pilobolus umbonatus]